MIEREELWLEGGGVRFVYSDDFVESVLAERDEARMVAATGAKYIEENDALKSALREAKKVLKTVRYRSIRDEPVDEAIATINKVFGEE